MIVARSVSLYHLVEGLVILTIINNNKKQKVYIIIENCIIVLKIQLQVFTSGFS